MRSCAIEDCGKLHYAQGWCIAHWKRWKRHGDPIGGRPTMGGEPMRYFREIVLAYDGVECLTWPYARTDRGYGQVYQDGRVEYVHRMVCKEVNGPPPTPKHDAAHSCGKGHEGCATKRHLSWKTRKENMADAIGHGTLRR